MKGLYKGMHMVGWSCSKLDPSANAGFILPHHARIEGATLVYPNVLLPPCLAKEKDTLLHIFKAICTKETGQVSSMGPMEREVVLVPFVIWW